MSVAAYQPSGDLCLSFWAKAMAEGWVVFPPGARVLEIGCAEADWQTPMLAVQPDLQITGIDWRACLRPGVTIRGDVLTQEFSDAAFDAVVSISAIEHIGLGAYEDDPRDPDGDTHAMQRAWRWLKPGGWMYLDVPFRAAGFMTYASHRAYDDAALLARLAAGFEVTRCVECVVDHPDGPYAALLLTKPV